MKVFAKFDEIPSMTLQDIKETKCFGHTFVRSFVCSDGRTDNVKTVYPPINKILRKQNVSDTLSFVRSFVCSDGRTDNVKTVYPPINTVCGGYKKYIAQYIVPSTVYLLHLVL